MAPSPTFLPRTEPDPEALARHGLGSRPCLLFVGVVQKRKNLLRLMKALAAVRTDLLLAVAGPVHTPAARRTSPRGGRCWGSGCGPWGYAANEELPSLFAGARAMALVSEYESFGIPWVEAMACGCPVVAADAAAMPEVVGEAGELRDPGSVDSIAAALERVLLDEARTGALRAAGLERARGLGHRRAARETFSLYATLR